MFIFEPFMPSILLIILLCWPVHVWSQTWFLKTDLTDSLRVQTSEGWSPLRGAGKAKSAWLILPADRYRGDYLVLESGEPLFLFVEGSLRASGIRQICWPIDSIRNLFGKQKLRLNLYQPQGNYTGLQVYIKCLLPAPVYPKADSDYRPSNHYRDFLLTALALTIIMLLIMAKVNRLLVMSYLSVNTLLSFRESADHPMYNRVTNTTNLLLLILVIFILSALRVQPESIDKTLTNILYGCLKEMLFWGMILMAKGLLIFLFSAIFKIQALKGLQYIGFVRYLLLLGLVLMTIQVSGEFIFSSTSRNLATSRFFVWAVAVLWLVLIWGKLRTHTRFSVIHLFSYLCATEMGPLLLTATANWKA